MSWASDKVHQDLSASGSYDASSALAKQYAATEENQGSRVDDGEGWRQVSRDDPPKTAAEYADYVKKWSAAGFDVKAIDMDGDDFTHSNIAVKPKEAEKDYSGDQDNIELSPRLATARARALQYEEDRVSGQAAKDLYDSANNPAEGFLNRYKTKLGEQLENGMYKESKHTSTNSSKVASGKNDVSIDVSKFARTGIDKRKDE